MGEWIRSNWNDLAKWLVVFLSAGVAVGSARSDVSRLKEDVKGKLDADVFQEYRQGRDCQLDAIEKHLGRIESKLDAGFTQSNH